MHDGILVVGDTLLASITPNVGLYPDSRPDPLGDYLESLRRIVELGPESPSLATMSRSRIRPARRRADPHHRERLEQTTEALGRPPQPLMTSRSYFSATRCRPCSGASPSPRRAPISSTSSCGTRPGAGTRTDAFRIWPLGERERHGWGLTTLSAEHSLPTFAATLLAIAPVVTTFSMRGRSRASGPFLSALGGTRNPHARKGGHLISSRPGRSRSVTDVCQGSDLSPTRRARIPAASAPAHASSVPPSRSSP